MRWDFTRDNFEHTRSGCVPLCTPKRVFEHVPEHLCDTRSSVPVHSTERICRKIHDTLGELSCNLEAHFSKFKKLHNSKIIAATQKTLELLLMPKFKQIKMQLVEQSQFIQRCSICLCQLKKVIFAEPLRQKIWDLELDQKKKGPCCIFEARHQFLCPTTNYIQQERTLLSREFSGEVESQESSTYTHVQKGKGQVKKNKLTRAES